jgi:creatinine amidohydrolase/Fe(II)-dependent formamide hydrolase-like protein
MAVIGRILGFSWCALLPVFGAHAQVMRATTMTSADFAKLNRARTVIILPGGILEEHGPYLPIYTDGFLNQRLADSLAIAIDARPGWTPVIFPAIPLGNSGANDIGARFSFPGTYAVRFETLRDVFMDLADELGAQGFRWVFVVHLHGAPNHSRALDDAGDYFHATYQGRMVHLAGLMPIFGALEGAKSPSAKRADGLPIHSGMDETSLLGFIAPSLLRSEFRAAKDQADSTMDGLIRLAEAREWPGYLGAPRLASRAHGARVWRALADSTTRIALRILDGADVDRIERYSAVMDGSPPDVRLDAASRRAEGERAARQQAWLRARSPSGVPRSPVRRP